MDVIVYRYEAEDKNGPYHVSGESINSLWDLDNTPIPVGWKINREDIFCFLYRSQARRWFPPHVRREMRRKGVRLRVYRVPLSAITYSDGYQVAINRNHAKQLV